MTWLSGDTDGKSRTRAKDATPGRATLGTDQILTDWKVRRLPK